MANIGTLYLYNINYVYDIMQLEISTMFYSGDMSAPPPVIYTDPVHQLCSPVHHHLASTDSRIAPPTFKQIIQSKLLHRRVKLNVGGVR